MQFLASLSPVQILRQLRQGQESSTFERLSQSSHVADLRLIFSITLIIIIVTSFTALLLCFQYEVLSNWKEIQASYGAWIWARLALSAVADGGVFIGAIGAAGCGVLAWTYQTGSARLGVVDLFACEIATLCRVAAVSDMVPRYIRLFHAEPDGEERRGCADDLTANDRFTSQERYFPVFESSIRDLQQLEADVVNNVTAFYTYMKVMRDALRKLAEIRRPPSGGGYVDEWHHALCNVIYTQFLGFESARKAIRELVEYEPTQAEDTCTILLSELSAYAFLREQFKGDLRQRRLAAREEGYRRTVPELCRRVRAGTGPKWETALDLAEEVMKLHAKIFPVDALLRASAARAA